MKEELTMGNKTYTRYVCAICGGIYSTIADRSKCEQACVAKQEEEERKAAEAKRKEEQDARRAEVDKAIEHAEKLLNAYVNDYGEYHKCDDLDDVFRFFFGM